MSDPPVVVLTALNLEYRAVRALMSHTRIHKRADTRFEIGTVSGTANQVVLALAGRGNHSAAVIAERAIAEFSPAAVIFVGIAGGLQERIKLGDVVVATHVYAYHGGTSEDDGLKARPRTLAIHHSADQIAHAVDREATWMPRGPSRRHRPTVHFGPIAAGEVVHYSTGSEQAQWLRRHYNDAVAVETEGAGVAQAAHLNGALPVLVVRGISDRADSSKVETDGEGWQERAARNAAAFAAALVDELVRANTSPSRDGREADGREAGARMTNRNTATNSTVGIQAHTIHGAVVHQAPPPPGEFAAELAALRAEVRAARLDADLKAAAEDELDAISAAAGAGATKRGALVVALKRLRGLVSDVADLGIKVAALISLAENKP